MNISRGTDSFLDLLKFGGTTPPFQPSMYLMCTLNRPGFSFDPDVSGVWSAGF